MADVRLRGDEGHRHAVAHLGAAQRGFQDEQEFKGRPKATLALNRADDHRAWIGDKCVKHVLGHQGMVDMANRLGVAVGPEAWNFVKSEIKSRRDDQVVIGEVGARNHFDAVFRWMNPLGALRVERDAALAEHWFEVDLNLVLGSPADGHPGV